MALESSVKKFLNNLYDKKKKKPTIRPRGLWEIQDASVGVPVQGGFEFVWPPDSHCRYFLQEASAVQT